MPKERSQAPFAAELVLQAQPPVKIKVARAVAQQRWPMDQHLTAEQAAQAWRAAQGSVGSSAASRRPQSSA